ncbi:Type 1 glutamine amidotransferase-like domain-containing protein [Candidatus Dojkabacteria bacterium]|nr:Type 1 glutamine amidotransferase-like domain-containing protein [Candidatus Dojkabacteria bacterium]
MLTKFYLHGGGSSEDTPVNLEYRKNILAKIAHNPKILLCYFASEPEMVQERYKIDSENLWAINPNIHFDIATEENFEEECKNNELIFLAGGDTFRLLDKLKQYPNFSELIKGKIVVGTSAGAYALSKYFYSNDENRIGEGLGILNIKIHCHYSNEKFGNVEKLKEFKEDIEIVTLKEQEYVVVFV